MTAFSDGGKHVWLATASTEGLLARKTTTKIAEVVKTNHDGTTRIRDRQIITAVTTRAHTRPVNMVLSHPRQPSRLPRLLRGSASGQPTIRTETPTRANQVPFAPATDSAMAHPTRPSTALSGTSPSVSQDARVTVVRLTRGAAQIISVKSPRAPTPPADDLHGVVPAMGTSAPSMPPPQPGYIFYEGRAR